MFFTETDMQNLSLSPSISNERRCREALESVTSALKKVGYSYTVTDEMRPLTENVRPINSSYQMLAESFSYFTEMRQANTNRVIRLFTQGSYANNTNIEKTSDVDIAVILESTFSMVNPTMLKFESEDTINRLYEVAPATDDYNAIRLKNDVESALKQTFGTSYIERKNKSVKVKGNSTRADCDTVPAKRRRDYSDDKHKNKDNYVPSIMIYPDDDIANPIINFPEQHIFNGVFKERATENKYKKCVRALKNIKEIMSENGYFVQQGISSFGLESLLWNVANSYFTKSRLLLSTFDEILNALNNDKPYWCLYKEANGIKPLFTIKNPFIEYVRFFNDLSNYFKYGRWG
jgi:predicted nucleotidyltransferase